MFKLTIFVSYLFYLNIYLLNFSVNGANVKFPIPSDRTEDTNFWLKNAENYLYKILKMDSNMRHNGATPPPVAKNIIIFIGDGMGLPTITAGRIFKGQQRGRSGEEEHLTFDLFPNVGLAKTYNVDRQVPDSAGTATAIFTGVKTNSGVLGYDSKMPFNTTAATTTTKKQQRLTTIMDWAIGVGKRTGFVTTTRVTHATPAALYAHIPNRNWECDSMIPSTIDDNGYVNDDTVTDIQLKDIARQLIENVPGKLINVILAGGKSMMGTKDPVPITLEPKFNGSTEKFCSRTDQRNLIDEWLALKTYDNDDDDDADSDDNLNNINDDNHFNEMNGIYRNYENRKNKRNRKFIQNTGQLLAVNTTAIKYLLGLFAHNHMSYDSVRDRSSGGQPSLGAMTKTAIDILKNSRNGFVLLIEGGRIDQAHHQNHAQLALQELLELDRTIGDTLKQINLTETLVIVTADHSHAMTFNGYPLRGNDILGLANKNVNIEPYETLTYANGPGFWKHRLNKSMEEDGGSFGTWLKITTVNDLDRHQPTYQHHSAFPLQDETHGGEDVPVYAIGAGAHLIRGSFEQNYIGYVMSYVGCMGPAKHLNAHCLNNGSGGGDDGGSSRSNISNSINSNRKCDSIVILLLIYCFMIIY